MGEDFFVEWRKKENVRSIEIPNKSILYRDLMNIEHSWSGRMDTNIGNTFIMGHSDSTITLQVYSHFIPDTQEKALNALNNLF